MRTLALVAALAFTGCASLQNPADSPVTLGQALYLLEREKAERMAFDKQVAEFLSKKPAAASATVAPVESK